MPPGGVGCVLTGGIGFVGVVPTGQADPFPPAGIPVQGHDPFAIPAQLVGGVDAMDGIPGMDRIIDCTIDGS